MDNKIITLSIVMTPGFLARQIFRKNHLGNIVKKSWKIGVFFVNL